MHKLTALYLGIFSIFISFFSFLNIVYSYYFKFYLNLNSYIYTLIISLGIGIILIVLQNYKFDKKISLYDKLFIITFGFFYFPLLISLPYYFSIYKLSLLDSYFEAVSGFTSTGFTIFNDIKSIDDSIVIWRSSSQWLGGLYYLFSLILLIEVFDIKVKNFLTSFISINLFEIRKQFFKIFLLYFLLTFIIFLLLNFSGIRLLDSFNLSMTIISSGGFMPTNTFDEIITNNNQYLVISFTMLISFFSLFLFYNLLSFKKTSYLYQEDILLFFYLIILVLLTYVFFNDYYDYKSIFFSLASSLSNIGLAPTNSPNRLVFLFLIIVIIGGGYFSTSSGLNFIKVYVLIKFSLNELLYVARPKYVTTTKLYLSGIKFESNEVNKYFLSFLFFLISLFFLSSLLSFYGVNFKDSFILSILTLTNTVNSSIFDLASFDFFYLKTFPKILLIFFMIIGRIEILAFIILFKKFFLKN